MIGFLNNAWVIGIGGGILSGIIVTIITRYVFSKKDNGIYMQNLRIANNEVIYALRPTISENCFPQITVIEALIEANSRKFKVNCADMFSIKQIAEELTKEIMDTSFISYQKKEELFKHLIELYEYQSNDIHQVNKEVSEEYTAYKKRILNSFASMLGVMVSIMTVFVVVYPEINSLLVIKSSSFERVFFPTLLMMLMFSFVALTQIILKHKIKIKYRNEINKEKDKYVEKLQH